MTTITFATRSSGVTPNSADNRRGAPRPPAVVRIVPPAAVAVSSAPAPAPAATVSSAPAAGTTGAAAGFVRLWRRYREWREIRRTIHALDRLGDGALKDIGLTRGEIEPAALGLLIRERDA